MNQGPVVQTTHTLRHRPEAASLYIEPIKQTEISREFAMMSDFADPVPSIKPAPGDYDQ